MPPGQWLRELQVSPGIWKSSTVFPWDSLHWSFPTMGNFCPLEELFVVVVLITGRSLGLVNSCSGPILLKDVIQLIMPMSQMTYL